MEDEVQQHEHDGGNAQQPADEVLAHLFISKMS
jgi:hypothetical protein